MGKIIKMASGDIQRLDGYEEYIISAASSGPFVLLLEGQVQVQVEKSTQVAEWITLATITDGTPQPYSVQTPFIRATTISGTPIVHLQALERAVFRNADLSLLQNKLGVIGAQNPIGRAPDFNYATVALFAAAPVVNGKFSYVLETGEYFEGVGGVQVSRGRLKNRRTPRNFGAVGNGIANDSAALTLALSAGNIKLEGDEDAVYRIESTVPVGSNVEFFRATLLNALPANGTPLFRATDQSNINFHDLTGSGPVRGANVPHLLQAVRCKKITYSSNATNEVLGLYTLSGFEYADTTPVRMCSDITVLNNNITVSSALGKAGVQLDYTDGAKVRGNTIKGVSHGIQWWGGDANQAADGLVTNLRKCTNLVITENTVNDVAGGGIWGSMGRNIQVHYNTVERCGDVGIDFEGTFDSVASFNTVNDCVNGEMALFFESNNVKFLNNQIRTINTPLKMAATNCRGIVFNDNVVTSANTTTINDSGGAVNGIEILRNTFTKVSINLSNPRGQARDITIADNKFTCTNIFAVYVITDSASTVKISKNKAVATSAYANFAFDLQFPTTTTDSNILIEGNTTSLYGKGIQVLSGATGAGRIVSQINGNTVATLEFIVGAAGFNKQILRGNYVATGPFPDSTSA